MRWFPPVLICLASLVVAILGSGECRSAVRFTEVGLEAGVGVEHDPLGYEFAPGIPRQNFYGAGAAWCDLNHDGWPDLIVANGKSGNFVFLNNGDGSFDEVAEVMGLRSSNVADGVAVADLDNDGFEEIVFSNYFEEPFFYPGKQAPLQDRARIYGFVPVLGEPANPDAEVEGPATMGVSFGDYDGDGYLDVYLANYRESQQDRLYHSVEGRYFRPTELVEVTRQNQGKTSFQPVFWDFDDDGDMDIYVAVDFSSNLLFVNLGPQSPGVLEERAAIYKLSGGSFPLVNDNVMSMGVAMGDFDGDLDIDVYVTNYIQNALYVHPGDLTSGRPVFLEQSVQHGLVHDINSWGTAFFDADNDGDLDLAMLGGWIVSAVVDQPKQNPDRLWINGGAPDHGFTEIGSSAGFDDTGLGRALALADYDRDGDLDLLATHVSHYDPGPAEPDAVFHPDRVKLYRNDMDDAHHWVSLKLVGGGDHGDAVCNLPAIGARVYLTAGGETQLREVRATESYLGQHSLEVEYGLGTATSVQEVRVRWMCGAVEIFQGVTIDGFHRLVEGSGVAIPNVTAISSFEAISDPEGVRLRLTVAPWLFADGKFAGAARRTPILKLSRAVDVDPHAFEEVAATFELIDGAAEILDTVAESDVAYRYLLELDAEAGRVVSFAVAIATAGSDPPPPLPQPGDARVGQNYPNPFNPGTTILFELPRAMDVRLLLFDARGRQVAVLYDGPAPVGETPVNWDGTNGRGVRLASGTYRYLLVTPDGSSSRSLTLVR